MGIKVVFNPNWNGEDGYLISYNATLDAYRKRDSFKTNQMCFLEYCWYPNDNIDQVYDIYIVNDIGVEVKIVNDGSITHRDIKPAHNLYKMWRSGRLKLNGN